MSYGMLRDVQLDGIDARLQAAANAVIKIVTRDYHNRISDASSIPEPEFMHMMERLDEFAHMTGMTYVYTYMPLGDGVVTVSTNATEEERKTGTFDRFFHFYEASELMKDAIRTRQIRFENLTDEYGVFRSVYIPFTTESGKIFLAGADLPISFVNDKLNELLLMSAAIGAGSFVIFFLVGYIVLDRVIRPLVVLTEQTRALTASNFAVDAEARSELTRIKRLRRDEVGQLAAALATMLSQLETYIIDLRETTTAKERAEGELSAARDIQMGILPRDFPAFPERPEFDLYAVMEPAKAVGGDLYDFFMVDDRRLLFLVGDVSGKGVPAALFMAVAKTLFKNSAARPDDPLDLLMHQVNQTLISENPSELFITAFVGLLDLETGTVEYCDAGHDAPYILHADGTLERVAKVGGLALCLFDEYQYRLGRLQLTPGDSLFLFTDGVSEAQNPAGDLFGFERLAETVRTAGPEAGPEDISRATVHAVTAFADGAEQSDDITILVLKYKGRP